MRPRENLPPKNPDHILELSNEGESPPKKVPRKFQNVSQKKSKSRSMVIETSDESNRNNEKKTRTTLANNNSDTELENEKETPEEEVGKFGIMV